MSKGSIARLLNWRSPSLKNGLLALFRPSFLPNFKFKSTRIKFDDPDRLMRADDEDSEDYNFWGILILSTIIFCGCAVFFHGALPFGTTSQWQTRGSLGEWLKTSVPIFAWGSGLTILVSGLTWNDRAQNRQAEALFAKGIFTSLVAGVLEEIAFRWIIFYSSIALVLAINWLFFGWAGFGLMEFIHNYLFGPVINWLTLGSLSGWLVNKDVWFIGAGMITANGLFRDGHKYLGPVGYVNSWFIGMFMFFLLQSYGLVACIVCHFIYDLLIFGVRYLDMVLERALGRV